MKRITTILSCVIAMVLTLVTAPSCSRAQKSAAAADETKIVNISFENRHKDIFVDVKYSQEIIDKVKLSQLNIDSVAIEEHTAINPDVNPERQPQIIKSRMLLDSLVNQLDINTLVIVDLTTDEQTIREQQNFVRELYRLMQKRHLFVAFMGHHSLSQSFQVTDYVIDNKFVKDKNSKAEKYLYRSLVAKIDEMRGAEPRYFEQSSSKSNRWEWLRGDQKAILLMSDGLLYKNYRPIDPAHFDLQQTLMELSEEAYSQDTKEFNTIPMVYYYDTECGATKSKYDGRDITKDRISHVARNTKGRYYYTPQSAMDFMKTLSRTIEELPFDVRIHLQNPDNKLYQGEVNILDVSFFNRDTLVVKCDSRYSIGSSYNPIVVNETTYLKRFLQGLLALFLIVLVLYVVLQILYPAVSYLIFRRRYVKRFYDPFYNMNLAPDSLQNRTQECCYYCKAPLEHGELYVEKCSHKLHLECWEENNHQCPEYGEKCPDARHYYNRKNLFDIDNAPYIMRWIFWGVGAGALSWLLYLLFGGVDLFNTHEILDGFARVIYSNINGDNISQDLMAEFKQNCFQMPIYGMNIAFWITLSISYLMSYDSSTLRRYMAILARAIVGGAAGYVTFFIGCAISIAFDVKSLATLSYLLSWPLLAVAISLIVTFRSDTTLTRALIGASITTIIGIMSIVVSYYVNYSTFTNNESMQVINYLVYTVGFTVSLAITSKISRRYYLRAEGATKPLDIALYKWYRGYSSHSMVTLGKSVDCNIQMSWDINSMIAPRIGYIVRRRNRCYLVAEDDGILFGGKEMGEGETRRLYHHSSFVIGQTLFTYVERDI